MMPRPALSSDSSDEASGIENPGGVEGRLEPAHERERALIGSVEKLQGAANLRRGGEQSKSTARRVRGLAPSGDDVDGVVGGLLIGEHYLRDPGAGGCAIFNVVAAGLKRSREQRWRHRDLCGQSGRIKIGITQQLVTPEAGIAFENFAARAEQIADSFGLVVDFQRAAGKADHKKKSVIGIEASTEAWTEYIEITQWKCVIEYIGGGERLARERERYYCERVVIRNRANFKCRLSYYSKCAERSAHQFHQIIPGDVFDHAPAAVNDLAAVTHEANSDKQVARSALGKTKRSGVRGTDQRAESG